MTLAAEQAGVPLRTARRWLASYQANGSAGLSRAARSDLGSHRIPAELRELAEGLALRRPPPRIAHVHRVVRGVATAQGWPAPSYDVVRRIVHRLDPGLVALAHHDPDVCRDNYELVLRRESAAPNAFGKLTTLSLT